MFAFTRLFLYFERGSEADFKCLLYKGKVDAMTIKEIEEAAGMQRANIRFYEAEGFLKPEREKNGYRNYSEKDLEVLKKIKLLRSLHISLEEIKAMHQGEQDLSNTLEKHIVQLMKQQEELGKSRYVCEKMQRDGATYEKLNTEQYLLVLKNCRPELTEKEEWIKRDTPEPVRAPFLRIFARLFDYLLYAMVWMVLVFVWHRIFGLRRDALEAGFVYTIVTNLLIAFLLEPLFLTLFGTTPGKALLGLRVSYDFGGRIPMEMAWARSWRAILGLHDWQYHDLFQMINTYTAMANGEPLAWDYEANTFLELKDEKTWRKIAFVSAVAGCVFTIIVTCVSITMLPNKGNITTEEFVENYNTLRDAVYNGGSKISNSGEWIVDYYDGSTDFFTTLGGETSYLGNSNGFSMTIDGKTRQFEQGGFPKKIDIVEENGVVTEVGFFYETKNRKEYLEDFGSLMFDLAYAFVEGEQNYNVFTYNQWDKMKTQIMQGIQGDSFGYLSFDQGNSFKDFSFVIGGVEITCDVELQGYELWQRHYVAKQGEETYYSVRFSVKKKESK